jgi:hypothetical protein
MYVCKERFRKTKEKMARYSVKTEQEKSLFREVKKKKAVMTKEG